MSSKHSRAAQAARHRRNQWLIWGGVAVVAIVAVVIAAVASGGGSDGGSASSDSKETAPVTVSGTKLPDLTDSTTDPAVGMTIPTLTGTTLDGKPIEITPNGKPQAIVFLAHWCPHCQAEVPRLVTLAKSGALDGIDVTAVATGTNSGYPNDPPSTWLKDKDWPFPVMADSAGPPFAAADAFGLTSYPYFVLVDADGKVAGRTSGEVPDADVVANVKALLAGEPLPLTKSGASSSAK
jgi:cytochrome c biogenesis protein CcmG/thiol:disulfide interchange protein DsbE